MTDQSLRPQDTTALTRPRQPLSSSSQDDRNIAALIARLLLHYFVAELSDAARQQMAVDWLCDLREFGPEIVSAACDKWRRQPGGRRPTPGDIRVICIREQADRREAAAPRMIESFGAKQEQAARRRVRDEEMQAEGRDIVNAWARRRGCADIDAYAAARGIHWSAAYATVMQEILAKSPLAAAIKLLSASALGVTAREFSPSAERMAADRRALGLDPPEEAA